MSSQFTDYDRITDILIYLSDNLTLNFTTVLSKKDKSGNRSFYHYEAEYASKYLDQSKSTTIKRIMNFYFTLDNKNDWANGFIIRPQDAMMLIMLIENQLLPLYFDNNSRIFKIIDDKLVINREFSPIVYAQTEYKFISFTPIVCSYENGEYKEGVRITVNKEYTDIDIDKFMGFYYIIKNTDMYSVACAMCTYVKTPPYNINVYSRQGLGGGGPLPDEQWNSTNDNINTNGNFFKNLKSKNDMR